jgi:hypothetical protein
MDKEKVRMIYLLFKICKCYNIYILSYVCISYYLKVKKKKKDNFMRGF